MNITVAGRQLLLFIILMFHAFTQKTWLSMMTTKFKSERSKIKDDCTVLAARSKFSAKRKLAASSDDQALTAKRVRRPEV